MMRIKVKSAMHKKKDNNIKDVENESFSISFGC